MRLGVRTFLYSVLPLAAMMLATFWGMEHIVGSVIHYGLRSALRDQQILYTRMQLQNDEQNRRFLRILGENATLKAGLQLVEANDGETARLTLEDQLGELCQTAGLDLLAVSSARGEAIAGVMRKDDEVVPFRFESKQVPARGFFTNGRETWQITSMPLNQGDETIAVVSIGQKPDFDAFGMPVVLTRGGSIVHSTVSGIDTNALQQGLESCTEKPECDLNINGTSFLSFASAATPDPQGYEIRSLANVEEKQRPVQATVRRVFIGLGAAGILGAVITTIFSTRSVISPVSFIAQHLRESASSGRLLTIHTNDYQIREIREMIQGFNRAALAIREGEDSLRRAYLQFVGSLASAVDARDPYTAGHSARVADLSCRIAVSLGFSSEEVSTLRIGALLHDVGKIGIPDQILGKPERLDAAEFEIIKQHPVIGRRILEGVHGFEPYLDVVELHHENWDGTGYPHGRAGEDVPLPVRIVHVADAYDAMTSDRPYRRGLSQAKAVQILQANAGTQFDPHIVDIIDRALDMAPPLDGDVSASLLALDAAISTRTVQTAERPGVAA